MCGDVVLPLFLLFRLLFSFSRVAGASVRRSQISPWLWDTGYVISNTGRGIREEKENQASGVY